MRKRNSFTKPKAVILADTVFFGFIAICVVIVIGCLLGCYPMQHINDHFEIEDDHPLEDLTEDLIDAAAIHYFGVDPDVELTPRTSE